jgi:hypothetical protein
MCIKLPLIALAILSGPKAIILVVSVYPIPSTKSCETAKRKMLNTFFAGSLPPILVNTFTYIGIKFNIDDDTNDSSLLHVCITEFD